MKQITIIGNIGANAVMRTTSDGRQLMSFNVAVNQTNADPIWFNCIGSMREKLFPYLIKGQCICVVGDLQARVYNGSLDLGISVDKCELCGKAPEQSSQQTTAESFDATNQQVL